jgi:hypothetical protein
MTQTSNSPRNPQLTVPPILKITVLVAACYASFLGMEIVHEFGHVLNAIATGGRVVAVEIPLIGTSQTLVAPNPQELFEIMGGPLWGILIPLLACGLARYFTDRVPETLKFFAGFCLIANGAYLAIGWWWPASDGGQLARLEVPKETLVGIGVIASAVGLGVWHSLPWLTHRAR